MIFTFYSYKGGVGRSMALANVAKAFANHSLRVVLIDWDLEAPGLEAFFCDSDDQAREIRSQLGLIDMLTAYKRRFPSLHLANGGGVAVTRLAESMPSVTSMLCPLEPSGDRLWLLTAGWREGERFADYATAVQSFNWSDFYAHYAGESYFEWLRGELLRPDVADVVLIDSRTGVTEMGGVTTRQLADVVVSFCVPNDQNLAGVTEMTASFRRPEVIERRGRDLDVMIVPTRIDASEIDRRNRFEADFAKVTSDFTPLAFLNVNRTFWDLKIPYVSKYAYEETLVVGDPAAAEELEAAYQSLAAHMALLAPSDAVRVRDVWEKYWQPLSKPPTAGAIPPVFIVPMPPNRHFTGREALMSELRTALERGRIQVLQGIRGVGKTALAIQYVYDSTSAYDVVCWIDASNPSAAEAGFRLLGESLGLSRGATDDSGLIAAVQRWLTRNQRWLLVLDDATPGVFPEYVPPQIGGHVLATSSDPLWGSLATVLRVPALTQEEAVAVLVGRTGSEDRNAAQDLAGALENLPLALEAAASYAETTGRSLRATLDLITSSEQGLLGVSTPAASALRTVLESGIRQVMSEDSAAAYVLGVSSFLAPEDIPLDVFFPRSSVPFSIDGACTALRRAGLAEVRDDRLRVHRLVQAVTRDTLDDERRLELAVDAMGRADNALSGVTPASLGLPIEHATAAVEHVAHLTRQAWREDCANLLVRIGEAQRLSYQYGPALASLQRANELGARTFKPLDDISIETRIGRVLAELGDLAAAREVLVARPGHDATGTIELGRVLAELGELDEAEKYLMSELFGAVPMQTATAIDARLALAQVLVEQSRTGEAEKLLHEARSISTSEPPPLRRDAEILVELGRALLRAGDSFGARSRATEAIQEANRTPHPPDYGRVLVGAATLLADSGDVATAADVVREALTTFAAGSPDHASALNRYGVMLIELNDLDSARTMLESALAADEHIYGPDHPTVARDLADLARVLAPTGDVVAARVNLERAAWIVSQIYPPGHRRVQELERQLHDLTAEPYRQVTQSGHEE